MHMLAKNYGRLPEQRIGKPLVSELGRSMDAYIAFAEIHVS